MNHIRPLSKTHEKALAKLTQKKFRQEEGLFIAEGKNSLEEALTVSSRYPLREIILNKACADMYRHSDPGLPPITDNILVSEASDVQIHRLSTEKSPQGIIIVCQIARFDPATLFNRQPRAMIYLDHVTDPGNLGMIIRTARWFGLSQVLLSPDCVDPWNQKVIRSSAGTLFSCEIYQGIEAGTLFELAACGGYETIATVPDDGERLRSEKSTAPLIIVFGNEAHGVSAEIMEKASRRISIPGSRDVESLNLGAAAAIVLYEIIGR